MTGPASFVNVLRHCSTYFGLVQPGAWELTYCSAHLAKVSMFSCAARAAIRRARLSLRGGDTFVFLLAPTSRKIGCVGQGNV